MKDMATDINVLVQMIEKMVNLICCKTVMQAQLPNSDRESQRDPWEPPVGIPLQTGLKSTFGHNTLKQKQVDKYKSQN